MQVCCTHNYTTDLTENMAPGNH